MAFNLTSNDVRGPLRWWYNIGAPPDVPANAPLKMREQARIGKLISLALFIELIEMGIAGFSTTEDPNKTLAFAYLGIVAALLLALVLNRFRPLRRSFRPLRPHHALIKRQGKHCRAARAHQDCNRGEFWLLTISALRAQEEHTGSTYCEICTSCVFLLSVQRAPALVGKRAGLLSLTHPLFLLTTS